MSNIIGLLEITEENESRTSQSINNTGANPAGGDAAGDRTSWNPEKVMTLSSNALKSQLDEKDPVPPMGPVNKGNEKSQRGFRAQKSQRDIQSPRSVNAFSSGRLKSARSKKSSPRINPFNAGPAMASQDDLEKGERSSNQLIIEERKSPKDKSQGSKKDDI